MTKHHMGKLLSLGACIGALTLTACPKDTDTDSTTIVADTGEEDPETSGGDKGSGEMGEAEAEDLVPQRPQRGRLQFQPDDEEQHHHAELGDAEHRAGILEQAEAEGPDGDAGDQVAEDRTEAEALEDGDGNHPRAEQGDGRDQVNAVRFDRHRRCPIGCENLVATPNAVEERNAPLPAWPAAPPSQSETLSGSGWRIEPTSQSRRR